jgi:hypothetical protein
MGGHFPERGHYVIRTERDEHAMLHTLGRADKSRETSSGGDNKAIMTQHNASDSERCSECENLYF